MDGEDAVEIPIEFRLWLDEGLNDDARAAIASRAPFDVPDLDDDWMAHGLGWPEWGGCCRSLIDED